MTTQFVALYVILLSYHVLVLNHLRNLRVTAEFSKLDSETYVSNSFTLLKPSQILQILEVLRPDKYVFSSPHFSLMLP
jgi:hypothetical protein